MVFRFHTFLLPALVAFPRFTAQHGDDGAAALAVSFHEHVCRLAAELGCEVVKTIGDAVMVRSEDGATAVELATRILGLAGERDFPPARVGLDTGPAIERDGDWFGSTVNIASRVASAADAGELLMTERTREASAEVGSIALTARGTRRLKGL